MPKKSVSKSEKPSQRSSEKPLKNSKKHEKSLEKPSKITLFSNPPKALFILAKILTQFLNKVLNYLLKHWLLAFLIISLIFLPRKLHGPHSEVFSFIYRNPL